MPTGKEMQNRSVLKKVLGMVFLVLLVLVTNPVISKVNAYFPLSGAFTYQRAYNNDTNSGSSWYGASNDASVATADIDGDGNNEALVVDIYTSRISTGTYGGTIYIYDSIQNLSSPKTRIYSETYYKALGWQFIKFKDVNGDHIPDLWISARNGSGSSYLGAVYIILGRQNWPTEWNIDTTPPDYSFVGTSSKLAFGDMLFFMDFDNDGDEDIGVSYKNAAGTDLVIDVYDDFAALQSNTVQMSVPKPAGITIYNGYGREYSMTKDINADGKDDLIIGDYNANTSGTFIFFGGKTISTPDAILRPEAATPGSNRTHSIDYGDLNEDGYDDMCLGANTQDVGSLVDAGKVYCFWGGPSLTTRFSGEVNLSTADLILNGQEAKDSLGRTVTILDVDYDGKKDLLIGAYESWESTGYTYGYLSYYRNAGSGVFVKQPDIANTYSSGLLYGSVVFTYSDSSGYQHLLTATGTNVSKHSSLIDIVLRHGQNQITSVTTSTGVENGYHTTGTAKNLTVTKNIVDRKALLTLGPKGSWNANDTGYTPSVLKIGDQYKMWYSGKVDMAQYRIGYATSSDGLTWIEYANQCGLTGNGCVFNVGVANSWDDAGVYAPSVIYDTNSSTYKMWYTGFDGSKNRIGYATSSDGMTWTKYDDPGVAACGFSEALDDGCVFNSSGVASSWDQIHVTHPKVILDGSTYKMWYTGTNMPSGTTYFNDYPLTARLLAPAQKYYIGYATSTDGIAWTRYDEVGNAACGFAEALDDGCIVNTGASSDFDSKALFAGNVIKEGSTYTMWYTGVNNIKPNIQKMTSPDGIAWTKAGASGLFTLETTTMLTKDEAGAMTPYVLKDGSTYRMYYTGSDITDFTLLYASSTDGQNWTRLNETFAESYSANIKRVEYKLGNGSWTSCSATDGSYNSQQENFSCTLPATEGNYSIQYRLVDANDVYTPTSSITTKTITVDNTAPSKPVITTIGKIPNIPNKDTLYYYFTSQFAQIRGTAEAGSTVHFKYGGKDFSAKANSSGEFLVTVTGLPRELVEFDYYAQDAAGNKSSSRTLKLMIGEENFPAYLRASQEPSAEVTPTPTVTVTSTTTPTPTITVYGILVTDESGKALPNTTVYLNEQKFKTDTAGKVYLNNKPVATTTVRAEVNGKSYTGSILGETIVVATNQPIKAQNSYSWLWWVLLLTVIVVGYYVYRNGKNRSKK